MRLSCYSNHEFRHNIAKVAVDPRGVVQHTEFWVIVTWKVNGEDVKTERQRQSLSNNVAEF